jgi:hypothetical protein
MSEAKSGDCRSEYHPGHFYNDPFPATVPTVWLRTNGRDICCSHMARTADLQRKSEECAQLAQRAEHAGVRARYQIVAEQWAELAERAAKSVSRNASHRSRRKGAR